mmetsp:Transcript_9480/g.9269  ORF Transcript_9480/g.9269 Transcript_9480/m.9269 type:complete len:327 (+) Transcript_9480:139-1119(+)
MCITEPRKEDVDKEHDNPTGKISVGEIIGDILIRPANMHKLMTKEDGHFGHVHKIIGSVALAHYIYRAYLLVTTGSMQFDSSIATLYCIMLHALLSGSSFIFKIPNSRVRSAPMIYPEFRLHSVIFAYRSLIIMVLMWISKRYDITFPLYLRGVVILLTMFAADTVTNSYKDQGTTMRAMPMPSHLSSYNKERLNLFYSMSQIIGTSVIMHAFHLDEVFAVVFPIQLGALLMTMVRKSIITTGAWHFYYTLSLLSNFGVGYILIQSFDPVKNPAAAAGGFVWYSSIFVAILRYNFRGLSKYLLWGIVCLAHLYATLVLNRYTSMVL